MSDMEAEIVHEQAEGRPASEVPLSNAAWFAFLIFGWVALISIPAIILLGVMGHRQKVKDAIGASLFSIPIFSVLSIAIIFTASMFF